MTSHDTGLPGGDDVRSETRSLADQIARLTALEARLRATLEPPAVDDTTGHTTLPRPRRRWRRERA